MKALGPRPKRLRTLCGGVVVKRQVYYCWRCRQTRARLDERLGVDQTGMTPGLTRVVCRTALELAYQQSQQLLNRHAGIFSLLGTGSRTAGQTAWPGPGGLAGQGAESEAEISGPGNLLFSDRWGDDPGLAGCPPTLSELA
jgi:hypothetical protein